MRKKTKSDRPFIFSFLKGSYNLKNSGDWCAKKLIDVRKRRHATLGVDEDDNKSKASRAGE